MGRFTKLIKESNNKTNLATHPLFNADESKKKNYFQALVFVCVEDENFSDEEKEYLKISLVAMGLDVALFDEFEKFTQEPEEDELLELIERLKEFSDDEKFSFLVDVCVVAFKDGDFDDSEMELFEEYLEMLDMKEHKSTILYLSLIVNNKYINGVIIFYLADKERFNKFKYLFDLLKIDIEKELEKIIVNDDSEIIPYEIYAKYEDSEIQYCMKLQLKKDHFFSFTPVEKDLGEHTLVGIDEGILANIIDASSELAIKSR
jgi:tellurite resistance protein